MNYQFPEIYNISQVLPLIADRKEFVVAEKEGYTVINYLVQMSDTFPPVETEDAAILRELRGLVFDNVTGKVIARRYHKFFNVNEKPETQLDQIDFSQPHVILEKMDGSMITPIPLDGEIRWGTKMGCTDVALPVETFISTRPEYAKFAAQCRDAGLTPIFEWCSRQQMIVIDYPTDMLVLTAIRDNVNGEYMTYPMLNLIGQERGIPIVKAFEGTAESMEDLIAQTNPIVGREGFVVRFSSGHMIKVKAEDYIRKHHAKDSLSLEKNVISMIADEKVDDVKAFLDPSDLARVQNFEKMFWKGISETAQTLGEMRYNACLAGLDGDKRTYAVDFVQKQDQKYRPFLYKMMEPTVKPEVIELLVKTVASQCGTQTKVNDVRWIFNCNWLSELEPLDD